MLKLFRNLNISIKLALPVIVLLVLSIATYVILSDKYATDALYDQAKRKSKSEIKNEATQVEQFFQSAQTDLLFLSRLSQLNKLSADTTKEDASESLHTLTETFQQLARTRKVFSQIRFIDQNGQELIKVDYKNGNANSTERQALKNSKGEEFFVKTRQLQEGQFYHTTPYLKKDRKQTPDISQPTLTYATPVMDKNDQKSGMIVVDLDLNLLMDNLRAWEKNDNKIIKNKSHTNLSLLTSEGYYVYHTNNTLLWGKDLKMPTHNISEREPDQVQKLLSTHYNEPLIVDGHLYTSSKIVPNKDVANNYLVLLYKIPKGQLNVTSNLRINLVLVGLVFILITVFLIVGISSRRIVNRLSTLRNNVKQLMKGNIPETIETKSDDEIGEITHEINELTINISQMVNFADKVGTGDYSAKTKFKPDIVLGNTLIKMRDNLQRSATIQDRNNWVSDGLAKFSEVLRSQENLLKVGDEVIVGVVEYMSANQGALYMLSEDKEDELSLLAYYGIDKEATQQTIKIDHGLAGQAFRQGKTIHISDIPKDYGYISSITGKAAPNNVLIVPLTIQETVEGVLEISSFKVFEDFEVTFVEHLAEAIAITISSVKSNHKTKSLLQKSRESEKQLQLREEELNKNMQKLIAAQDEVENKTAQIEEQKKQIEKSLEEKTEQTEMLLAQEEEMRQNMEELQATQEAMSEKQRELEKAKKKLEVNEQVLKKAYKKARDRELEIKQKNEELKAQEEEIRQNMEELKATQEAMERKQIEIEGANKKLAANEKVLKLAYEQVKESESEIRKKNEEIVKQSQILEDAKDELERKNKKMAANERVLKKAYEKIQAQEQGLKDTINQLQTTEEELRQNMEELQTTQEALQEKSKSLEVKNKLITNSINYAKNIQTAILPKKEEMDTSFADYYVLYMPKDIVSGDFYWFRQVSDKMIYLAIVDCTGHGVPGALMSMIGSSILNRTLSEHKILEPGKILEHLHIGIRARLRQKEANTGDGMVVSMARIEELPNGEFDIIFSAAKQNIYYIEEDGEMKVIKGDRKSIGGWQRENYRTFSNQPVRLKKGTKIYFTTDGILDNPNPRRKRFGEKYLKHIIHENYNLPFETQKQILHEKLIAHQQDADQRDDITVIGIQL
ncbi:SpoIIE family protein phosphatase [Microscilla marina]|uniref:Serine/threonine kinase with GAF domain n=1 Tax=Microscilla marina ATCC 23134 TaxID=313606 RepID=A1ZR44_MICM2|nr:SpoIIE family protein phosphatase [Microscilla marina]EAY27133.1 serine/threonine kinase with GAF domain [Microscilla marina ATCC 23134]